MQHTHHAASPHAGRSLAPVAWTVRVLTLAAFGAVAGACATISAGVDPAAREAGVTGGAHSYLRGNWQDVEVYRVGDPKPLKVVMVMDQDFGTALANEARRINAQGQANATGTSVQYSQKHKYSPAIYLDRKPQRLRLVRKTDGAEAFVDVKPHIGKRYVVIDWLISAPLVMTPLIIDWATGKWKMFHELNVDAPFRSRTAAR